MFSTDVPRYPVFDGTQNCLGKHDDGWTVGNESPKPTPRELRNKDACATCPFLMPCRRYALHHDVYGIWGGLARRDREALQKRLGITPIPMHQTYERPRVD